MYRMHQNKEPGSYCLNANNFSIQAVAVHAWVKTATLKGELLIHSSRETDQEKKCKSFNSPLYFVILNNTEDKLNWVCFYQFQSQLIKSSLWKVISFSGFKIKWFRYTTWKSKSSPCFYFSVCSELGSAFSCRQVTRKVKFFTFLVKKGWRGSHLGRIFLTAEEQDQSESFDRRSEHQFDCFHSFYEANVPQTPKAAYWDLSGAWWH